MKCDDCLNLLEAYVDDESTERETEQVRAHLMTCIDCANESEALGAERDLYTRYDRELQVSPAMWKGIAAQIATENSAGPSRRRSESRGWFAGLFAVPRLGFAFSGAMAVLIAAFGAGYLYLRTTPKPQPPTELASNEAQPQTKPQETGTPQKEINEAETGEGNAQRPEQGSTQIAIHKPLKENGNPDTRKPAPAESDLVFTETAFADRDTASHLEQAENLLESFRSIQLSNDDQEVDVSYEKAESRRLLNENVVLRRDAEMTGKYPTKSVLGTLEPFLIDIANLPEKASARDVQQIKDRVQRTEIVAELRIH